MKLSAFRIRNFRSMVDSKVNYLSNDNITALIGQNESGKTTILEALHSFSNGTISEDMLRSDSAFPVISCYFEFNETYLKDYLDLDKIPLGLKRKLQKKKGIWLERSWKNLTNTIFRCSDNELVEFYKGLNESDQTRIETIHKYIQQINEETNELRAEIQIIERDKIDLLKETDDLTKRLNKAKRILDKAKKPDQIKLYQHEHEALYKTYTQKKIDLDEILKIFNDKQEKLEAYGEKDPLAVRLLKIKRIYNKEQESFDKCNEELQYFEGLFNKTSNSKELELLENNILHLKSEQGKLERIFREVSSELDFIERVAEKVLAEKNTRVAESEVKIELSKQREIYTLEQIGDELSTHLPVFEFFEDFASLLPNRIDLSDLFDENTFIEGYKAVNNFLAISGLSSSFFKQENDRILKQRIENLNGEITIDFHEFWSQKISAQNKIHLNFELEHYDNSIPEKSGNPYLEFWIKDNYERLYPKQRSRGVRWFLSFYLELKATAMSKQKKVLLIDEPGLSLHAKAQQDVLKVFENLKNDLQIIYCTHSPQLIDMEKMYRVLAVQRKEGKGMNSQSVILDSKSLKSANSETMMPLFSVFSGHIVKEKKLIKDRNLIVDDISTFYYLSAFSKLIGKNEEIYFIPSNGVNGITVMTNLFTGWKTDFSVLLPGNVQGQKVFEELKNSIFIHSKDHIDNKLILMEEENIVDLFSKLDFKKHILNKRIGIPETNSEYIEINNLSGIYLASQFATMVDNGEIQKSHFDEQTTNAITNLLSKIENSVSFKNFEEQLN
ncbi:MAG: AAA family ATPase [Bacteroidales bacterium]|jgi:predicted ATP-dependent endonuclease of OLD family|nr:AAA family ATPase [Bacteroidales bacterium]